MEKSYDPQQVETRWYRTWLEQGYFTASVEAAGQPYSIVIPPPNITGSLHMGHALNNTLQDILIRWRRMQGLNVLWVPGTDHAGIATQNVLEKQLLAEGTTRDKLGRDRFIQRVWEWKARSGGTIVEQLKRLGSSCDWDRLRFTMDEGLSKAVREVFVRLYEDGLIYRGERLINWCPRCLTALSDIEVEHEETTGKMYHIRYPLADDLDNTALIVATTRPETMLADVAVAVHPEDSRFRHLVGKMIRLPLTSRQIPIVQDKILVDLKFGTGAVKITPAHDFNDEAAGKRHDLPLRTSIEDHKMALGKCYRCKTVVEPFLSTQWFVKIKPLAEPAIKVVQEGRIRFVPESWTNNYMGWMREIRDWCISRQIWWGHQIPAWYCAKCHGGGFLESALDGKPLIDPDARPIVAKTKPTSCPECGHNVLVQDPDVLDTWFSSALWPFSTLGWPEQTADLQKFYPTSTLVTGLDILFFWVARMIMMGLKFTGDVPFRDVYIHALVRDAEGQKMSKSKGNVIDPLQVMDKYGTDALRFTLAAMASPGRDIKLSEERIEGYRNFANKLWNAARFILMNLEGPRAEASIGERPDTDQWILSRLHQCIGEVNKSLETYRFDEAANTLYHFTWHEYCDWYLELAKPALADKSSQQAALTRTTLIESFDTLLRLLHPFMPFITEEIWQAIPHTGDSIMVAPYPTSNTTLINEAIETQIASVTCVISAARNIRGSQGIPPSRELHAAVATPTEVFKNTLNTHKGLITSLARINELVIGTEVKPYLNGASSSVVFPGGSVGVIYVDLAGLIDVGKEKARIEKRLKELAAQMEQDEKKLSKPDFVAKVPPDVLKKTKARHEECRAEHEKLSGELRRLGKIAGGSA